MKQNVFLIVVSPVKKINKRNHVDMKKDHGG